MCFSATASFTAGFALSALGLATLALAPAPRDRAFAAIPLLFGLQQLTEGALWLALQSDAPVLRSCLTAGFTGFAEVLWPLWAPLAVWLIEPEPRRRQAIALCGAAGVVVAMALLFGLVTDFAPAELRDGHIFYGLAHYNWFRDTHLLVPLMALYVLATCVAPLLSSDRLVATFGAAVTASLVATFYAAAEYLVSVWCFFAALLSVLVAVWVAGRRQETTRPIALEG